MSRERMDQKSVTLESDTFIIREDPQEDSSFVVGSQQSGIINSTDGAGADVLPLISSKMANLGTVVHLSSAEEVRNARTTKSHNAKSSKSYENKMDQLPERHDDSGETSSVKALLAKLQEQERLIEHQRAALETKEKQLTRTRSLSGGNLSSRSSNHNDHPAGPNPSAYGSVKLASGTVQRVTVTEVDRLQTELQAAQSQINAMNEELVQNRIKNTVEQVLSQSTDDYSALDGDISEQTMANLQNAFAQTALRPTNQRSDTWPSASFEATMQQSTTGAEFREQPAATAAGPFARQDQIWGAVRPVQQATAIPTAELQYQQNKLRGQTMDANDVYAAANNRVWSNGAYRSFSSTNLAGPPTLNTDARYLGRRASYNPQAMPFVSGNTVDRMSPTFSPSPIGTPTAQNPVTDFPTGGNGNIWSTGIPGQAQQNPTSFVSTIEPLNYRRLLERSVNCNWKYIVDKIVCNNDQQASIFLQQKLKIGTQEQKHAIVESIVAQAYPLMINRFGNFLVQRCFEHGTTEQIQGISNAIRGSTVNLSMDAFGCHVIQKAFDCVPEEFKATMVSELLRRIPETVIHRYACHVWQKLFELRWTGSPPQIMKYVNEALRGMWHEVALGETGSLVVQNIFENCLEEDKRPCITEVLEYIDLIAHGQFGNWCIQHICEHGAPHDRSRAIDVVIQNAGEYSMDQYASKVVEKCLKIGGNEFLDRYLDRVCEGRPDRPRIPLIDIASDQYGNYLVQWILQHSSLQHREQVAQHIRKHMVSLRGSKFGSRVGMLCCNPIYNRQPGGPQSPGMSRFRYGYR